MRKYLHEVVTQFEKDLNIPLMNKEYDLPLVEYIKDAWYSIESTVPDHIKIVGTEYTEVESELDINKYIIKREGNREKGKKRKKKEKFDYKLIDDDRFGKLRVTLELTGNVRDEETNMLTPTKKTIKKDMLIPIQDAKGYYKIKGKKYLLIYQMVEKSTYTTARSVVLKSVIANMVTKEILEAEDIEGNNYSIPYYLIQIYKNDIPAILFYMANGLDNALDKLSVSNVIEITEDADEHDSNNRYFGISSKCYVKVNKICFDKYEYIRSIVGGLLAITTNRYTVQMMDNVENWIKKLGGGTNYNKGKGSLMSFRRLLDETTKKVLKLNKFNKKDIYHSLRWMMMEYDELRKKDNLDMNNKRFRCGEYIEHLFTIDITRKLNNIVALNDSILISDLEDVFKFPGDILIQKMHSSGILKFDDIINDMTFWSRFKYTIKGPHSIGGKNNKNIGIANRGLHPSMLGILDIFVCGNSDPGTSGLISPFAKMKGLYSNDESDVEDFLYDFRKTLKEIMDTTENVFFIESNMETKAEYYNFLNSLDEINSSITVTATPRKVGD